MLKEKKQRCVKSQFDASRKLSFKFDCLRKGFDNNVLGESD